jgi:hypothetical protein
VPSAARTRHHMQGPFGLFTSEGPQSAAKRPHTTDLGVHRASRWFVYEEGGAGGTLLHIAARRLLGRLRSLLRSSKLVLPLQGGGACGSVAGYCLDIGIGDICI